MVMADDCSHAWLLWSQPRALFGPAVMPGLLRGLGEPVLALCLDTTGRW